LSIGIDSPLMDSLQSAIRNPQSAILDQGLRRR
jgi:hypothetical protein